MAKWADYCISKVKYDADEKFIEKVEVREDKGDSIGSPSIWKRSDVVSKIEAKKTFVTILKTSEGKWKRGQDVHVLKINNVKYIRTDKNEKESDNLENLPEF